MKHTKDVGFVIRRINFGEADKFVTIFCRDMGKITVIARGVRKIMSKRASSIELLNLIEFSTVQSTKNIVLTETKLLSPCSALKSDYGNVPSIFLICELIDKLCPENQKHEDIFNLLFNTIRKLNTNQNSSHIVDFEIELLSILGFWDRKREFKSHEDINTFIENLLERKIKTRMVFEV